MCKHIFLTGDIQVGKSTVVDRTLALLDVRAGGFRSGFGPGRAESDRLLYMWDAGESPVYEEPYSVARITPEGSTGFPKRFDDLGCAALERARETGARLILMDECGFLERDALTFQKEVLRTLDGGIPVLGVVRLRSSGWTQAIRSHPGVELVTVTRENRDELPVRFAAHLRQAMKRPVRLPADGGKK